MLRRGLTHRDLSEGIRRPGIEDILATGAEVVLTQCPSCRDYLGERSGVRVMHPVLFPAGRY